MSADTPDLRTLRARQEQERQALVQALEEQKPKPIEPSGDAADLVLEVGANVRLLSDPRQVAKVLAIKGNDVELEVGALRMRTKRSQIEVISRAEVKEAKKTVRRDVTEATKYLSTDVERRIDLRGEYGDDAVMKVERFLADASAHSLDRVEIIHGHGTGALGRRIAQHLKGHPLVQSYRYGEPQEGGAGVTIVMMK